MKIFIFGVVEVADDDEHACSGCANGSVDAAQPYISRRIHLERRCQGPASIESVPDGDELIAQPQTMSTGVAAMSTTPHHPHSTSPAAITH